eukprot:COSAG06_NODE_33040_length_496_cov_0.909320_1_plen_45_part_10
MRNHKMKNLLGCFLQALASTPVTVARTCRSLAHRVETPPEALPGQ